MDLVECTYSPTEIENITDVIVKYDTLSTKDKVDEGRKAVAVVQKQAIVMNILGDKLIEQHDINEELQSRLESYESSDKVALDIFQASLKHKLKTPEEKRQRLRKLLEKEVSFVVKNNTYLANTK